MLSPMSGGGWSNSPLQKGLFHVKHGKTENSFEIGVEQRENCLSWFTGVDAVTLIGLEHKSVPVFYNEYETLCRDVEVAAKPERPWGTHGYRGKMRGPVRVGLKGDKAILSVTGPLSERLVRLAGTVACKFTRVDLQVTCKMDGPDPTLAERLFDAPNLRNSRECGKTYQSLIQSPDGCTLYFNKRTSATYGRTYDKSREFAYPLGKIWRYEVEIKEELADRIGQVLVSAPDLDALAADYVASWYADRDVCVPIPLRSRPTFPNLAPSVSGVDQTLSWLKNQVKPSVNLLVEMGLKHKVEESLGVQINLFDMDDEGVDF